MQGILSEEANQNLEMRLYITESEALEHSIVLYFIELKLL